MKKITALILALAVIFSFTACKKKENGTQNAKTEYYTLQEINDEVGGKLIHPAVMGVTREQFFVSDMGKYKIAEYDFLINGMPYEFRFSPVSLDISQMDNEGKPVFSNEAKADIEFKTTDKAKLARWFTADGQYVLTALDDGALEEETFEMIAQEMRDMTVPPPTSEEMSEENKKYEGSYTELRNPSVSLTATVNGDGRLGIVIDKVEEDGSVTEWSMNAASDGNGLLNYTDCSKKTLKNVGEGKYDSATEYENTEGFFTEADGILYWDGASEKECTAYVFAINQDFPSIDD